MQALGSVEGGAAKAVAAHFGAGSVGVEDDHLDVGVGGGGEQEDAVGADAEVPVAELADGVGWEGLSVGPGDDDEVVAEAMHFGEGHAHGESVAGGCWGGVAKLR